MFQEKEEYINWVKRSKPNNDFPSKYNLELIDSIYKLRDILLKNKDKKYMSFDTETTGLDFETLFLVGYSFSFDGINAYYVPVNHNDYYVIDSEIEITQQEYSDSLFNKEELIKFIEKENRYYKQILHKENSSLGYESVELIYKKMLECEYVFLFNARYDLRVMEKYGFVENGIPYEERNEKLYYYFDMSKIKYLDVQVMIFLADTNIKFPSLKKSEEYYLGWRGDSFEETIGDLKNFYYVSPLNAYRYAATDALGTFQLATIMYKFYQEANTYGRV